MDFHETRRGKIFFEGQLPQLINSINELTSEVKRMNDYSILNSEDKGLLRNPYRAEIEIESGKKIKGTIIACKDDTLTIDNGTDFIKLPLLTVKFIRVIH